MSFCFVCTALWRAGGMKAAVCFRQFLSLRINFVFSLSLYSCRLKLYRFRLQLYVFSLKINFSSDAAGFSRSVTSSLPPCLAVEAGWCGFPLCEGAKKALATVWLSPAAVAKACMGVTVLGVSLLPDTSC